ncbi:protein of unknown function [Alkalibacterium putridalgicola]|uniref:DUF202 domain-containing protein n=1 Tax=Alkalibacterium putridalgicola TaxID=426703 RepID=A0A1H7ST06_9LACT|nr:DUF202 domain-containing protein [Alkalibacterium putridalgicola]GEK89140.1 hypothetical protein APU01nite_11790 [Alkalibacterium putridalgicola]SEL75752.1 protein of unknown function [Alkalibacterium putridalgicola]
MSEPANKKQSKNELAELRTDLAEMRNAMAESRTLLAAERTYAAWIRIGFTLAGAGWTLGTALRDTENATVGLILGGCLIFLGMFSFIYAWIGYKAVYDYLKGYFSDTTERNYPSTLNLTTVTIISVVLLIVFAAGFVLLLFN